MTQIEDGTGELTLTITFDQALGEGAVPSISTEEVGANIAVLSTAKVPEGGTCTAVAGLENTYDCIITGLNGCRSITSYTATVSVAGLDVGTIPFNTADDEFDGDELNELCWSITIDVNEPTASTATQGVEDGYLVTTLWRDVGDPLCIAKECDLRILMTKGPLSTEDDFAATFQLVDPELTGTHDDTDNTYTLIGLLSLTGFGGMGYASGFVEEYLTELLGDQGVGGSWQAAVEGDERPSNYCTVKQGETIRGYMSFDGSTWILADEYTLNCVDGDCIDFTTSTTGVTTLSSVFFFLAEEDDSDVSQYISKADYVRFNTNVVDGDASDCPAF